MSKWIYVFFLGFAELSFGATLSLVNKYQSSMPTNVPFPDVSACIYDENCKFLWFEIVPFGADPISVTVKGSPPFQIQWLDVLEKPIGVTRNIQDGDKVDCAKMTITTIPICGYIDPKVEE